MNWLLIYVRYITMYYRMKTHHTHGLTQSLLYFKKLEKIPCNVRLTDQYAYYVKIWRIQKHVKKLIKPDQTGFFNGRYTINNIRRALHLQQIGEDSKTPSMLLSLDAEKAFYIGLTGGFWNKLLIIWDFTKLLLNG